MKKNGSIAPWLQLIRIPNLFTIPGDILVGYLIVTHYSSIVFMDCLLLIICSSLFYSGGLILNDIMDYDEDLRERPDRPLPSGQIEMAHAKIAFALFNIIALGILAYMGKTPFIIGLILAILIILYNGPARKKPEVAFSVMGACRGVNILLGASLILTNETTAVFFAAIIEAIYIFIVCKIAYSETEKLPEEFWCLAPLRLVMASSILLIIGHLKNFSPIGLAAAIYLCVTTFNITKTLNKSLPVKMIPPKIGALIRNLLPMQAAFIAIARPENWMIAAALIAIAPVAGICSKKFYSS